MPMKNTVLCGLLAGAAAAVSAQSAAPAAAAVDAAAVQRCRIIAEPAARLACYDAIALPGLGSRSGWGAPVAGATAPAAAAVPAPGAAAAAAPADRFGLPAPRDEAEMLDSRVAGAVTYFENGTQFTLQNGQVWQIVDNVRGAYQLQDPAVRIERAALGSFVMSIEGVSQRPRVRRIR